MLESIIAYTEYLRTLQYSESTIRLTKSTLIRLAEYLRRGDDGKYFIPSPADITAARIKQYHGDLNDRYPKISQITITRTLVIIRSYFAYLTRERKIVINPAVGIELPKTIRSLPEDIPTIEETRKILTIPDTGTIIGIRSRAILETLYSSGLRCGELMNLNMYDIDLINRTVTIRKAKGNKDRIIPLNRESVKWIKEYTDKARPRLLKESNIKEPALFIMTNGRRISATSIWLLFRALNEKTQIPKNIHPHGLRHAIATHLARRGADIRHIQKLLGHASISSTQIYLHTQAKEIKNAYDKCHPRDKWV